jgi:signal transduction histidine kinase
MHSATLLAAVRLALRARRRQHQLRDLLEQQERYIRERGRHAAELARALAQRTLELTESHEMQRRTEAMAVLGSLSVGISHDLGNLLLPLRMRLEDLQRLNLTPDVRRHLDAITQNVNYVADLGQRLRQYMSDAASDHHTGESLDLAAWAAQTRQFFRSVVPARLHLECDVPSGLPPLAVNKAGLTQAVYNLIQNASKAIRSSGVGTTIQLRSQATDDGGLTISVEDDGPGMSPEVLRRCTEPKFTTDAVRGSSGLGLSLVNAFAQSAGGTLEMHSPPPGKPRGTCASIRFSAPGSGQPTPLIETKAVVDAAPRNAHR